MAGVEGVAQSVTKEVESHEGQREGEPGCHDDVGRQAAWWVGISSFAYPAPLLKVVDTPYTPIGRKASADFEGGPLPASRTVRSGIGYRGE